MIDGGIFLRYSGFLLNVWALKRYLNFLTPEGREMAMILLEWLFLIENLFGFIVVIFRYLRENMSFNIVQEYIIRRENSSLVFRIIEVLICNYIGFKGLDSIVFITLHAFLIDRILVFWERKLSISHYFIWTSLNSLLRLKSNLWFYNITGKFVYFSAIALVTFILFNHRISFDVNIPKLPIVKNSIEIQPFLKRLDARILEGSMLSLYELKLLIRRLGLNNYMILPIALFLNWFYIYFQTLAVKKVVFIVKVSGGFIGDFKNHEELESYLKMTSIRYAILNTILSLSYLYVDNQLPGTVSFALLFVRILNMESIFWPLIMVLKGMLGYERRMDAEEVKRFYNSLSIIFD